MKRFYENYSFTFLNGKACLSQFYCVEMLSISLSFRDKLSCKRSFCQSFYCTPQTGPTDLVQPNHQSQVRQTHLCQSRLLVADFVLADGRQLLQCVAVVGERPRQASELGPSCRNQTSDTASVRISSIKTKMVQAVDSRDGEELQNIPTAFALLFV